MMNPPATLIVSASSRRIDSPRILFTYKFDQTRSVRFTYDNVNASPTELSLAFLLYNPSAAPIALTYRVGHAGPDSNAFAVGHAATAGYLASLDAEKPALVSPNSQIAVIARSFAPDQWLCGIVDVAGAQGLVVQVVIFQPSVSLPAAGSLPTSRGSVQYAIAQAQAGVTVDAGSCDQIGALVLESVTQDNLLAANWGVLRTFTFTARNESADPKTYALTFAPINGDAAASFLIDGKLVEIARVSKDEQRIVHTFELGPGQQRPVDVRTMTEFHSTYPAQICLSETLRGEIVSTIQTAGTATSRAVAVIRNATRTPKPSSRIAEPLASRVTSEPDSLTPHLFDVILELNPRSASSERELREKARALLAQFGLTARSDDSASHHYLFTRASATQIIDLVALDEANCIAPEGASPPAKPATVPVFKRVWEDHVISAFLVDSVPIVKADAARAAFAASGKGIVWAVLDSGVAPHPHFSNNNLVLPDGLAHRDFTGIEPKDVSNDQLIDPFGHGTHVAGIIAGEWKGDFPLCAYNVRAANQNQRPSYEIRKLPSLPTGIAPHCTILSMRVIDENGIGNTSSVVAALDEIFRLNDYGRGTPLIHGVNLSTGYLFDARWEACGATPICEAVNRLVAAGVVVAVAAGNSGDIQTETAAASSRYVGLFASINDPGNAQDAITVASAYNRSPRVLGIAPSSSKGPTADGRLKPDIAAPGDSIVSCAAPARKAVLGGAADYVELSGTSMAAPHVSGVAAAFLSVRKEYIKSPAQVKSIMMRTATDLGRAQSYQGAGLVDAFRMLTDS